MKCTTYPRRFSRSSGGTRFSWNTAIKMSAVVMIVLLSTAVATQQRPVAWRHEFICVSVSTVIRCWSDMVMKWCVVGLSTLVGVSSSLLPLRLPTLPWQLTIRNHRQRSGWRQCYRVKLELSSGRRHLERHLWVSPAIQQLWKKHIHCLQHRRQRWECVCADH